MYVEGRLKTRQYVDAQNVTRYVTEVLVDKMMSMGTKRTQSNPEQVNASYNSYQQSVPSYQPAAPAYQAAPVYQQPAAPAPVEYQAQPAMSAPQPSFNNPPLLQMPDPGYDGDDLPF